MQGTNGFLILKILLEIQEKKLKKKIFPLRIFKFKLLT
jgi:hypothetical protein